MTDAFDRQPSLKGRIFGSLRGQRATSTATLNDSRNDTGRTAFCGPTVISAVTGYSISKIEDVIRANRNMSPEVKCIVVGTYSNEVEEALRRYARRSFLAMEIFDALMKLPILIWNNGFKSVSSGGNK